MNNSIIFSQGRRESKLFIFLFMIFCFCFSSLTYASMFQHFHDQEFVRRSTLDTLKKIKNEEGESNFPGFLTKKGWETKKQIPSSEEVNRLQEKEAELIKLRAQFTDNGWQEDPENPGLFIIPSKNIVDQTSSELEEKRGLLSELKEGFVDLGWLNKEDEVSRLNGEVPAKEKFDGYEAIADAIRMIINETDFSKNPEHFLGHRQRKITLGGLFVLAFQNEADLKAATKLEGDNFESFKRKFRIDYEVNEEEGDVFEPED